MTTTISLVVESENHPRESTLMMANKDPKKLNLNQDHNHQNNSNINIISINNINESHHHQHPNPIPSSNSNSSGQITSMDAILRSTLESFLTNESSSSAVPCPSSASPSHNSSSITPPSSNFYEAKWAALWKLIDPRKPNRHRKLVERTRSKLQSTSSKQVHQILLLNSLLAILSKYNQTLSRFQANSLKLHRCLIKWDALKARDQTFSRTSLAISLDLQNFMTRINTYYPASHVAVTPTADHQHDPHLDLQDDQTDDLDIDLGPQHPLQHQSSSNDQASQHDDTDPPNHNNNTTSTKMGLRTHLLIRYRLHRLRKSARKFNRQFRAHENQKTQLKLRGNQCIFDMVKDGKILLEINEQLAGVVLDLVLFSRLST